jgi:hypothetical protein
VCNPCANVWLDRDSGIVNVDFWAFRPSGVLVGGVLNALSTAYLEGHRNLASARVAARLVREDLRETHSRASASVNVGMYGPEANEGA